MAPREPYLNKEYTTMLSVIVQNSSKSPLAAGTGSRPKLARGAVASGWRSQSELAGAGSPAP